MRGFYVVQTRQTVISAWMAKKTVMGEERWYLRCWPDPQLWCLKKSGAIVLTKEDARYLVRLFRKALLRTDIPRRWFIKRAFGPPNARLHRLGRATAAPKAKPVKPPFQSEVYVRDDDEAPVKKKSRVVWG